MTRDDLSDLAAFAVIAEERSFTRAASRLLVSGSALSHALRGLEERLGVKLVSRTTRSVAPTEAGSRLLERLGPALADIGAAVGELSAYRDRPAGRVRISTSRAAALALIAPKIPPLKASYPDVVVELAVDDGLTDIVTAGFDAGVRSGELIARDMVSVRIGRDDRYAVVGSPGYFRDRPAPVMPEELSRHHCIAYRHVTAGSIHRWSFEKDGRSVNVAVDPSFLANDVDLLIGAALGGVGLTFVLASQIDEHVVRGALVPVLADWCMPRAGEFLYYPSRRQMTSAFRVVVEALRIPGD